MASKRRLRRNQCKGKQSFRTETEAAAAKHRAIKRNAGGMITYYLCRWCGMWHVGHAPFNIKQSVRDKIKNKGD